MYRIIIILILLALSAFFSACETAFSTVNKIRLKNYAAKGNKKAEKALTLPCHLTNVYHFQVTMNILNNQ